MFSFFDMLACVMLVMELFACHVCASVDIGYTTAVEANITYCMPAVGKRLPIIIAHPYIFRGSVFTGTDLTS
jgi:hypothetical protein